jgi:hypothetical protein
VILSGHQPTYLPGIILFNKISLSEEFMFVGHCQYGSGPWHNRNQIKGDITLSVPVKHNFGQSIDEALIDNSQAWKRKHIRSIETNYSKSPWFSDYFPSLREIIEHEWARLGPMNEKIIEYLCDCFGLDTEISRSQDYKITSQDDGNHLHIQMCAAAGADQYLHSPGEKKYVDESRSPHIKHLWQHFEHPLYPGQTETNLSAIDLLFNCGPESGKIIRGAGHVD